MFKKFNIIISKNKFQDKRTSYSQEKEVFGANSPFLISI